MNILIMIGDLVAYVYAMLPRYGFVSWQSSESKTLIPFNSYWFTATDFRQSNYTTAHVQMSRSFGCSHDFFPKPIKRSNAAETTI